MNEPTVSARELHEKLNIGTKFATWFPRMTEYGFAEGTDYTTCYPNLGSENHGGQNMVDYNISVDMAKQICMIQRTPEGKQCRQYLIDLEKAQNTPELVMARGLKAAQTMIEQKDAVIEEQSQIIEEQRPKAIFADAVSASHTTILVGDLAKLIKQNGIDIGQKRLFEWMRNNGYLIKRCGTDYNMPTQKAMELNLFEVKESTVNNPDGSVRINRTTKVTGKGQQYFINKFLKKSKNMSDTMATVRSGGITCEK